MKKLFTNLLILLMIVCILSGCAKKAPTHDATQQNTPSSNPVLPGDLQQSDNSVSDSEPQSAYDTNSPTPDRDIGPPPEMGEIDVDLTTLSSTMVYAEVFNIVSNPTDYLGKTIKVNGLYYSYYFSQTEQYYHHVFIPDATACCQQGLELIWSGDHTYPDDYPVDETEIEITGVFWEYDELGITYYYIATDDIKIL